MEEQHQFYTFHPLIDYLDGDLAEELLKALYLRADKVEIEYIAKVISKYDTGLEAFRNGELKSGASAEEVAEYERWKRDEEDYRLEMEEEYEKETVEMRAYEREMYSKN